MSYIIQLLDSVNGLEWSACVKFNINNVERENKHILQIHDSIAKSIDIPVIKLTPWNQDKHLHLNCETKYNNNNTKINDKQRGTAIQYVTRYVNGDSEIITMTLTLDGSEVKAKLIVALMILAVNIYTIAPPRILHEALHSIYSSFWAVRMLIWFVPSIHVYRNEERREKRIYRLRWAKAIKCANKFAHFSAFPSKSTFCDENSFFLVQSFGFENKFGSIRIEISKMFTVICGHSTSAIYNLILNFSSSKSVFIYS